MAYNDNSCVANLEVTGLSGCVDDLGYDAMLLWTAADYEIDTEANSKLQATYQDDIDAKNIYPMPIFDEVENTVEDTVKQDLPSGVSLVVREGKYGGKGKFQGALCNLPNLRTFNEVSGRAFIVTSNGKIWGTSSDGVKFKGFLLSEFHFSMLKGTDGTSVRWVELDYQFKNTTEMADYPAVPYITSWDPLSALVGLYPTTLTVTSSATASVVCTVAKDCDGDAVEDLVIGDFTILDGESAEYADGGSVAESPAGTYTFTFTGEDVLSADDYTINLNTAAVQTTGGYEPGTADSFTIE